MQCGLTRVVVFSQDRAPLCLTIYFMLDKAKTLKNSSLRCFPSGALCRLQCPTRDGCDEAGWDGGEKQRAQRAFGRCDSATESGCDGPLWRQLNFRALLFARCRYLDGILLWLMGTDYNGEWYADDCVWSKVLSLATLPAGQDAAALHHQEQTRIAKELGELEGTLHRLFKLREGQKALREYEKMKAEAGNDEEMLQLVQDELQTISDKVNPWTISCCTQAVSKRHYIYWKSWSLVQKDRANFASWLS